MPHARRHRTATLRTLLVLVVGLVAHAAPVHAWEVLDATWGGGRDLVYNSYAGQNAVYVVGGNAPPSGIPYRGQFRTYRYAAGNGALLSGWPKVWTTATNDVALAVAADTAGNAYVTGVSCDSASPEPNLRTISYDAAGNIRWSTTDLINTSGCGSYPPYFSTDAVLTADGTSLFISTNIANGGPFKVFKYNATTGVSAGGTWPVQYQTPTALCLSGSPCFVDEGHGIAIDPSGATIYVTGRAGPTRVPGGTNWRDHLRTVRLSASDGAIQPGWPKINGADLGTENGVGVASDGTYVYVAAYYSTGTPTCAIYKYTTAGTLQSGWPIFSPTSFRCTDLKLIAGNLYLVGHRPGASPAYAYLGQQYTTSGSFVREFGPFSPSAAQSAIAYGIALDPAGNVYITGQVDDTSDGSLQVGGTQQDMLSRGFYWTRGFPPNSTPTASSQNVSTPEDTPRTITLAGSDADGCTQTFTFSVLGQPANATVAPTSGAASCTGGSLTATVTFTPNANYNGATAFSFTMSDGAATSASATVTVTVTPVADPPTLTNPTHSAITATTATLGATVTAAGDSALTARGTCWGTTAAPTGNCLAEGGTAVSAFTHARSGFSANTVYFYRGYATNSVGTGYSSDGTFRTLPGAPGTPTFSSVAATTLTVNWTAPAGGATSYKVERCQGAGCSSFAQVAGGVTGLTYGDSGLTAGTTYRYRVRATNATGDGAFSGIGSVTTLSANAPPVARITCTSCPGGTWPSTLVLNRAYTLSGATSTDDGSITTYAWVLTKPDGSTQNTSGSTFTFTPTSSGTHSVTLTVTDNGGLTDDDTKASRTLPGWVEE